jgi:hypothetical protein
MHDIISHGIPREIRSTAPPRQTNSCKKTTAKDGPGHDALYGFIIAKIQPADITIKNKNKTHYAKDEQVEAK